MGSCAMNVPWQISSSCLLHSIYVSFRRQGYNSGSTPASFIYTHQWAEQGKFGQAVVNPQVETTPIQGTQVIQGHICVFLYFEFWIIELNGVISISIYRLSHETGGCWECFLSIKTTSKTRHSCSMISISLIFLLHCVKFVELQIIASSVSTT